MATSSPRGPSGLIPRVRFTFINGGAAGNHTLTGIAADGNDKLISVWQLNLTLNEAQPNTTNSWGPADLTSEFSITAANTINNTGGTATSGDLLVVIWYDHDWGLKSQIASLA